MSLICFATAISNLPRRHFVLAAVDRHKKIPRWYDVLWLVLFFCTSSPPPPFSFNLFSLYFWWLLQAVPWWGRPYKVDYSCHTRRTCSHKTSQVPCLCSFLFPFLGVGAPGWRTRWQATSRSSPRFNRKCPPEAMSNSRVDSLCPLRSSAEFACWATSKTDQR